MPTTNIDFFNLECNIIMTHFSKHCNKHMNMSITYKYHLCQFLNVAVLSKYISGILIVMGSLLIGWTHPPCQSQSIAVLLDAISSTSICICNVILRCTHHTCQYHKVLVSLHHVFRTSISTKNKTIDIVIQQFNISNELNNH